MGRDLTELRESYQHEGLHRSALAPNPVTQFERWWDEWLATEPYDASACILATADSEGQPSARFVLCRSFDDDGFVLYTNQESRKAHELEYNPRAALVFGWIEVSRQVRIEGPVTLVDDATADAYWASRPRGSQIGAWASAQSEAVDDRDQLDRQQAEVEQRFGADPAGPPIPRPPDWGGYRVGIERMEFWQGRPNRMHDRFEYRRTRAGWTITRLSP